jgi:hypothetical protein
MVTQHRRPAAIPRPRLRELAERGELVSTVREAEPDVAAALRADAYGVAYPLVYSQHTRRLEITKRHSACARSIDQLSADCYDGFEDDVHAVVDYLLRYAKQPIANLEGWIVSRLGTATVDGYRRRRSEIGALQRPRVPRWLARRLDDDPWLLELTVCVLEWVGVRATAGLNTWPTAAWSDLRAARTGRWDVPETLVLEDGETVLRAMREGRPEWYRRHVEVPLGHKQAPVVAPSATGDAWATEDRSDAVLAELADAALDLIAARLATGERATDVVPDVVRRLFVNGDGAQVVDLVTVETGYVAGALADAAAVRRLVTAVQSILADRQAI